ncbi:hypothetical protein TNCV_2265501 [Trichonephila clavipes]|nr:hypothetical protein TNCV_2265501 [Trichonephila clavipes]
MAKRDGGQHEKEAQNWGGQQEGGKANQDATWGGAKHETGRNGQNDKRHGRERTEAGAAKKGTRNRNKTRLVWFTVHECMRID